MVGPASNIFDPLLVGQIPIDRFAKSRFKAFSWCPMELAADFARVDCIASVVPRPVLHERNLPRVRLSVATGALVIKNGTNSFYDLDIRFFTRCTDVVGFAQAAA